MALVLASQSPRRRELMRLITEDFVVDAADIDEEAVQAATPEELAGNLAAAKALAVKGRREDTIIGCDTVVELDGAVLGKPRGEAEAARMLNALSGREHLVHTGLCVLGPGAGGRHVETTKVVFAPIPAAAIHAVIQTDEPYDKAGGYGIQGWAARFIPRIEGCYYNVMGLPVAALWQLLNAADETKIVMRREKWTIGREKKDL